jgi:HAE1 family hydrophobic/amphiphilic exporter-1
VDLQYVIKGPDIEELQRISERLIAEFRGKPGYRDIDTDLRLNEPQVHVKVKREKLADLGLSVEQVSKTLNVLFGKFQLGTYELGSESYNLYVKAVPRVCAEHRKPKKGLSEELQGRAGALNGGGGGARSHRLSGAKQIQQAVFFFLLCQPLR